MSITERTQASGQPPSGEQKKWYTKPVALLGAGALSAATFLGVGYAVGNGGEKGPAQSEPEAAAPAVPGEEAPAGQDQAIAPPVEDPGANLDNEPLPEPVPFEAPDYSELVDRFSIDLPSDADPEAVMDAWVASVEDYTNAAGTQNAADSREPTTSIADHALTVSQYYGQAMGDSYFNREAENSDDASRLYYELANNQAAVTAANIATRGQDGVEPFTQSIVLMDIRIDEHYVDGLAEQFNVPEGTFYAKFDIGAVPSMPGAELSSYILDNQVVESAAYTPLQTSYGVLVKPSDDGWKFSKARLLIGGIAQD